GANAGRVGRSDTPPGVQAPARGEPLGNRDCQRLRGEPPGGLTAPQSTKDRRARRRARRRQTTVVRGRHARHRRAATLAPRIMGQGSRAVKGRGRAGGRQRKKATMTEQTKSSVTDPNSVRKMIDVQAPPAVAWRVFTEQMATWWPLAVYKIGKAAAVDAIIEP